MGPISGWRITAKFGTVSRVRASDGKLLETWTGATGANGVLAAKGLIFVTGTQPGSLYQIDPTQPAGAVTTLTSSLGVSPQGDIFSTERESGRQTLESWVRLHRDAQPA